MANVILEIEPRAAARQAYGALREAGRYSGHGLSTLSNRTRRQALIAGAEGARRTGYAWAALRGVEPRRSRGTVALALATGFSAGVAATLVCRRLVVAWRASDSEADFGRRVRAVLRPPEAGMWNGTSTATQPTAAETVSSSSTP